MSTETSKIANLKLPNDQIKHFKIAAKSDTTVLLTGPTGSGKTFLANEIHQRSKRRANPFLTVNLATLSRGTLESELFGHEKGSYTGATQKRVGLFEMAQGGTLFLDEIGELPMDLQARLLMFLQDKTLFQVGSNVKRNVDVRIIAATNKDLELEVEKGNFRADLFHRLRVLQIEMKGLNERWDEFDEIVHHCLADLSRDRQPPILKISEAVAKRLESYSWPGNIRELRNVLEYAILSSETDTIEEEDLPHWFTRQQQFSKAQIEKASRSLGMLNLDLDLDYNEAMAKFEKEYLRRALERFRGRVNLTARQTGINRTTLIRRIRAFSLSLTAPHQASASYRQGCSSIPKI